MAACKGFKPFPYDPGVCDNCGKLADEHTLPAEPDGLTQAMWKVLLEEGGTWSYYGGMFEKGRSHKDAYERGKIYHNEMAKIDIHMTACEIDWKKTRRPEMTQLKTFAGTFASHNDYSTGLAGDLYCKCGEVYWKTIGMDGITLGQLIWKVVHADDPIKEEKS